MIKMDYVFYVSFGIIILDIAYTYHIVNTRGGNTQIPTWHMIFAFIIYPINVVSSFMTKRYVPMLLGAYVILRFIIEGVKEMRH